MELQSHLQTNLDNVASSLDRLRKEMLWPNGQQTFETGAPIQITWEQAERWFACQQALINALQWNEEARIQRLVGTL